MLSVASAMPALASAGLRSRVAPAVSAPTRLRIPDLLQMTDHGANDFLNGHFDDLLPSGGLPVDERWFTRIYGDDELDLWLISWVPDRSTELHDHGGSLGAVTVIAGELLETRWDGWLCVSGDWPPVIRRAFRWVGSRRRMVVRRFVRPDLSSAERTCLRAAADGNVVLRSDGQKHVAPQTYRPDRASRGMSRIDAMLSTARAG